jgi:hypothetical protein
MSPHIGVIRGHFTWFGGWGELPASYWYTIRFLSQKDALRMTRLLSLLRTLRQLAGTLLTLLVDACQSL